MEIHPHSTPAAVREFPLENGNNEAVLSVGEASAKVARSLPLDFLRGVAILLVLLHHQVVRRDDAGIFRPLAGLTGRAGWTGVDLFFVLSGFLIGGILFSEIARTERLDMVRFLVRRALKLWPQYIVFLLVASAVHHYGWFGQNAKDLDKVKWNLFHLQNYFGTPFGITWSLAVEEHFYLLLPFILVLCLKLRRTGESPVSKFLWIFPVVALGCLLARCRLPASVPYPQRAFPSHLRMDSLLAGVMLAYVYRFLPQLWDSVSRHRALLLFGSCVMLTPACLMSRLVYLITSIGFTLNYLGYGMLILACVGPIKDKSQSASHRFWRWPPVKATASIGYFSYGIYLWHIDVVEVALQDMVAHSSISTWSASVRWPLETSIFIMAAYVMGALMTRIIEIPFLALRDRLYPSR